MKRESLETVQSEIRDRIERMAGYLDRYQQCKQRSGKEKILGKIMLNGIYLKRYLNLILLSLQQERCPAFLPILELKFCLEESLKGLNTLGVSGSFYSVEDGKISGRAAIKIYHFFQQVIDEVSEDVSAVMISLRQEEQNIVCTMNVEADLCPVEAVKRCGAECEEDYDGSWLLSLTYREEVESCNFKKLENEEAARLRALKIRIHQELGRQLLLTHRALEGRIKGREEHLFCLQWMESLQTLFVNPADKNKRYRMDDKVKELGMKIAYCGQFPQESRMQKVFELAVDVCAANAVSHADAETLYVDITEAVQEIWVKITNDGKKPEEQIIEGGGLSELRRQVEQDGGVMEVGTQFGFAVIIVLAKEKGGLWWSK